MCMHNGLKVEIWSSSVSFVFPLREAIKQMFAVHALREWQGPSTCNVDNLFHIKAITLPQFVTSYEKDNHLPNKSRGLRMVLSYKEL